MKWCNSLTVIDRSIIRRKNERPGFTTRHACWSCPISASKSHFLQDFLSLHWLTVFANLSRHSGGSRSSTTIVSINTPRNVNEHDGHTYASLAAPQHLAHCLGQCHRPCILLRLWFSNYQKVIQIVQQCTGTLFLQNPCKYISHCIKTLGG